MWQGLGQHTFSGLTFHEVVGRCWYRSLLSHSGLPQLASLVVSLRLSTQTWVVQTNVLLYLVSGMFAHQNWHIWKLFATTHGELWHANTGLIPKLAQNALSVLQSDTCHFCPLWHKWTMYTTVGRIWHTNHGLKCLLPTMIYKPSLGMVLNQYRHTMICYFWIVKYVHFDGHALTLNEIVFIHIRKWY